MRLALNYSTRSAALPDVLEALTHRDRPGRSATQKHNRLARAWRRRRFGRRAPHYAFVIVVLLLLMLVGLHLSSRWALLAGTFFGMVVMAIRALPEMLMPGFIFNWQLGAWGEQMTASELRSLPSAEWVVRHDVRCGKGNHDHIVAGPAVYVCVVFGFPASETAILVANSLST